MALGARKKKKESGDRVLVERSAREEGDEIDADDGIVRYASDPHCFFVFFCFSVL